MKKEIVGIVIGLSLMAVGVVAYLPGAIFLSASSFDFFANVCGGVVLAGGIIFFGSCLVSGAKRPMSGRGD